MAIAFSCGNEQRHWASNGCISCASWDALREMGINIGETRN
jgi:hypothetical protein